MRVIITGSTGMVGKGVLFQCIEDDRIKEILLINRTSLNIDHPLSFVKYLEIDLLLNNNPRPEDLRFLLRIAILKKLYDKGIYTLEESENK